MTKIKYIKEIKQKGYPTSDKKYNYAHECANKAEKKANPKMYKAERKAEYRLKKGDLMATHSKNGAIKIEKKYKKFAPNLKIHELTEYKKDPGRKGKKGRY